MDGIESIAAERQRQIDEEGWTLEHDDTHVDGEMALAAACYASPSLLYMEDHRANVKRFVDPWPWDDRWDKRPHHGNMVISASETPIAVRRKMLVKAGALIAAEIDRLDRLEAKTGGAT